MRTITIYFIASHYSQDKERVHKAPPCGPPADAASERGHTKPCFREGFPWEFIFLESSPTRQLPQSSCTPCATLGYITIAKTASTPPAPGTPAQRTPGTAHVASTSFVCSGGSMGTPAPYNSKATEIHGGIKRLDTKAPSRIQSRSPLNQILSFG